MNEGSISRGYYEKRKIGLASTVMGLLDIPYTRRSVLGCCSVEYILILFSEVAQWNSTNSQSRSSMRK